MLLVMKIFKMLIETLKLEEKMKMLIKFDRNSNNLCRESKENYSVIIYLKYYIIEHKLIDMPIYNNKLVLQTCTLE